MKKAITLFICAIAAVGLTLGAAADVLFEPEDSFYQSHVDECSYYGRHYIINGERGCAAVYSSPKAKNADAVLPNGSDFYVEWVYNGEWAYVQYDARTLAESWNGKSGWLRMSDMTPAYDSEAFCADHESEIYDGERTLHVEENGEMRLWTYPGSGESMGIAVNYGGKADDVGFAEYFTDPEEREWGYLSYYYGRANAWVCLDDPENAELQPDGNRRERDIVPAASQEEMKAVLREVTGAGPGTAAICAAGVVVIAGAILIYFVGKKRKSRG